jgi:hypothetical protein
VSRTQSVADAPKIVANAKDKGRPFLPFESRFERGEAAARALKVYGFARRGPTARISDSVKKQRTLVSGSEKKGIRK